MALLLTKKTINHLGTQINENKGSKISNFAQNYMKKMGWSEGKGLGKDEDGIDTHIKVKKKEESTGLGLDKAVHEQRIESEQWLHDGFSQSLKALSKKKKCKKRKNGDDDEIEKQPTYDDLFKATGGARLGMRARASQNGKFIRTEHNEEVIKLSVKGTDITQVTEESISIEQSEFTESTDALSSESKKSKKEKTSKKDKKDKKSQKSKKSDNSEDADE